MHNRLGDTQSLIRATRLSRSVKSRCSRKNRSDESAVDSRGPRAPGCKRSVALHVGYVGTAFKGARNKRPAYMGIPLHMALMVSGDGASGTGSGFLLILAGQRDRSLGDICLGVCCESRECPHA